MTDLIMSVAKGYGWPQLEAYTVSLANSGFDGTKLMFVSDITPEARANLIGFGFELIDFTVKDAAKFITHERFAPAVEFLKAHHRDYRYVLWTDVRDLIFQTDPIRWLEKNLSPYHLLGTTECILIKNEPQNDKWLKESVSANEYARVREQEVCCGGMIAGDAKAMLDTLLKIYETLAASPGANDQAILNYVLRTPPLAEITRIPKMGEGFTVTCSWFLWSTQAQATRNYSRFWTDKSPVFDKTTGLVYTPDFHTPFSVVHQYDRDSVWKTIIETKYKNRPKVLLAITSCMRDVLNGANRACRSTFLKDLSLSPPMDFGCDIEYRFFIGDGTPWDDDNSMSQSMVGDYYSAHDQKSKWITQEPFSYIPDDDEIILHVPDDYKHTSHKTREKLRWATDHGFDFIFECFTDTYIDLRRLMASGFEKYDYSGRVYNWPLRRGVRDCLSGAKGGQGYWLSNRAAQLILDQSVTDWAEDRWVASIMQKNKIPIHEDSRYEDYPVSPRANNDCITSHLAETPKVYDPKLMYEVHELAETELPEAPKSLKPPPPPPPDPATLRCNNHSVVACKTCVEKSQPFRHPDPSGRWRTSAPIGPRSPAPVSPQQTTPRPPSPPNPQVQTAASRALTGPVKPSQGALYRNNRGTDNQRKIK